MADNTLCSCSLSGLNLDLSLVPSLIRRGDANGIIVHWQSVPSLSDKISHALVPLKTLALVVCEATFICYPDTELNVDFTFNSVTEFYFYILRTCMIPTYNPGLGFKME